MLYILLWVVHVIVCLFLIIVVLLQSGKAADLAGAFGGMGSQTTFGPRGSATVLSKATTVAAGLFMITSLTLAIMASRGAGGGSSVLDRNKSKATTTKTAPAQAGKSNPISVTPGQQGSAPGKPTTIQVPPVEPQPTPAQQNQKK